MDWTTDFYSKTGQWWGAAESKVTERDHQRLATVERLTGTGSKRVLELGSSYGNTAYVMAQAGHQVVGVEISDRIDFARQYEHEFDDGRLQFIKQDFYQATFDQPYDVICYWNGFGIGTDADQRRLLRRMAEDWLAQGGIVLMDIANPTCWIHWTGDEEHLTARPDAGYNHSVNQRIDFDPILNRFIDTWWDEQKPDEKLTQSIRCYSPADFQLLLEGTGLQIETLEVDGQVFEQKQFTDSQHPLWKANEYLVKLSRK